MNKRKEGYKRAYSRKENKENKIIEYKPREKESEKGFVRERERMCVCVGIFALDSMITTRRKSLNYRERNYTFFHGKHK